jgi:hypothetical protein
MSAFTERLQVALTLTIEGTVYRIAGGDVKRVELELSNHGWSGLLEFWVAQDLAAGGYEPDGLFAAFRSPDLIEVSVVIRTVYDSPELLGAPDVVAVRGIVGEKSLQERSVVGGDGIPVPYRGYRIRCGDAAATLWRQHFPCALYTGKSLVEVIDAEKGEKVRVDYDWEELETTLPLLFLGLDPTAQSASFYDFVLWTVDARGGVWSYDYDTQSLRITGVKDQEGEATELPRADVAEVTVRFPEVARHSVTVLNASSLAPASQAIAKPQAVEGVRRDLLMRSPSAKAVDDRVTLETRRLQLRGEELELRFVRMPSVTLRPGARFAFAAWSDDVQSARNWRVWRVGITCRATLAEPDANHLASSALFDIDLSAHLEGEDEPTVRFPAFVPPRYPRIVEGIVVSDQGEEGEDTWQTSQDEQTSVDEVEVTIPVFADQKVRIPFTPWSATGHLFLPAWRGARVLVLLDATSAAFGGFLDWKSGARQPMGGQGAGLVLGKTTTSRTALTHSYEGDLPTFTLVRTHATDTASITLKEGSLTIRVKEEPGDDGQAS